MRGAGRHQGEGHLAAVADADHRSISTLKTDVNGIVEDLKKIRAAIPDLSAPRKEEVTKATETFAKEASEAVGSLKNSGVDQLGRNRASLSADGTPEVLRNGARADQVQLSRPLTPLG